MLNENKLTIGIVGNGTVGNAVARGWMEHAEVRTYDIDPKRSSHKLYEVFACQFVFVCLPTEENTKELDDLFKENIGWGCRAVIIKSTTPMGWTQETTDRTSLPIVHSPEFLTERCAVADYQNPSRHILGWPTGVDVSVKTIVQSLYEWRWPGIPVHVLPSNDSETLKLFMNWFFGLKVTAFNVLRDQVGDVSYWGMLPAILSDGRITNSHTQVPGPDGKYGFGGKCLPKDIQMFAQHMKNDSASFWIAGMLDLNEELRGA